MIKYALRCTNQHQWDAWFGSISGYDDQHARGLVECPFCGTSDVTKAPMAPAVRTSKGASAHEAGLEASSDDDHDTAQLPAPVSTPPAFPEPLAAAPAPLQAMMAHIVSTLKSTHEDVGDTFAREVRAMHDGDVDARPIFGTATQEEVRDLIEDDIPILPIPQLPDPKDIKGVH